MYIPNVPKEDRSVLCLVSGGWDSTYMYSKFIDAGWRVTYLYVDIENNDIKSRRELKALNEIKNTLFPDSIEFGKITKTNINGTDNLYLALIIPLLSSLATTVQDEKFVAVGYVMGDDAISFLDEINALWLSLSIFMMNKPQLIFPLKQVSKFVIHKYLHEHQLLQHTTYCESVFDTQHCGVCAPCLKVDMLKKLYRLDGLDSK